MLKRIGGRWVKRQIDGDKFVCMDKILTSSSCLVYSLGINNDWMFEDTMAGIGCRMFAYDHTVNFPKKRERNILFHKLGLGNGTDMKKLDFIIKSNNHEKTVIDYMKVLEDVVYIVYITSME